MAVPIRKWIEPNTLPRIRMEWVEIIEPRTKEHMYANLTTGECVWDPPPGVHVKRTSDSQWWELFDHKTSRFYYYNAASQRTVWHRPHDCDIIPLAKLQTLKQNTEVRCTANQAPTGGGGAGEAADASRSVKKESVATQTPSRTGRSAECNGSTRREKHQPPVTTAPSGDGGASCGTQTQTSPVASPRPHRRHHHHHHSCSSSKHGRNPDDGSRHPGRGSDEENPSSLANTQQQQQQQQRKTRRGSHSSHSSWYSRHGKSQDSGRSSDSSSLSLSVCGSAKRSDKFQTTGSGAGVSSLRSHGTSPLSSPVRSIPSGTGGRRLDPPVEFGIGSTTSTPLSSRKKGPSHGLELSRQRSLDNESGAALAATPTHTRKPTDLFFREGSLSRSLSFMQQRRPQTTRGHGPLFDLWSPQHPSGSESAIGVDSLCTPMMHRKQRSLESKSRPSASSGSASTSRKPKDPLKVQNSLGSDSSPSPKRETESLSRVTGVDSGTSTLNEREREREAALLLRSTDSSPHSAGDSGLATTGSRASQDSARNKLANSGSKAGKASASASSAATAVTAAVQKGKADVQPEDSTYDPVPLYSNIDYNYYLDPKAQAHLLPLQQYILEQAKLSGYRFGDSLAEEEGDEVDSLHSDDSINRHRKPAAHRIRCREQANDDSDDFADDEDAGMSNVEDSSSQEYLDESQYLEEDDHYTQFLLPPVPPQRLQSKGVVNLHHTASRPEFQQQSEVIVESEYSEADPGMPAASGTFRSLPGNVCTLPVDHLAHHHSTGPSTSSLRPRKEPQQQQQSLYSPVMEKSAHQFGLDSFRSHPSLDTSKSKSGSSLQRSPSSVTTASQAALKSPGSCGSATASAASASAAEGDIEKYAQNNLNIHKKGLFRKNVSIRDMLSWSKDPIRKPMLPLDDKQLKKEACDIFKLVQVYMGDRKCKPGMTCNSVALELCNYAWNKPPLRDELYLHICRQTTENPRKDSLRRGWELLAVCLYFFPPSPKLEPYLDGYINRHRDPGLNFTEVDKWPIHVQVSHYATISCRRLKRIGASGRRNERKPTLEEIEQARLQIFRPSMFGNTLEEIMAVQRDRFPHRKLPWIQTTLSEEILRLQGAQTEGIFRVPADVDEVNSLKIRMDQWEVGHVSDAHVPASLLKLWYRELYESLIPDELYDECVAYCSDPERAVAVVHRLPEIHRLVLSYLIRFLQIFSQTEVSSVTKMDASNLAMVMAPNCLRCVSSDPKVIFDNARKEMSFIRTLIQHLDTSFMEGVV